MKTPMERLEAAGISAWLDAEMDYAISCAQEVEFTEEDTIAAIRTHMDGAYYLVWEYAKKLYDTAWEKKISAIPKRKPNKQKELAHG